MPINTHSYNKISVQWLLDNAETGCYHECNADSGEVTVIFEGEENATVH